MIPCIYYIVLGIHFIIKQHKILCAGVIVLYSLNFILFMINYFTFESKNTWTFAEGMKEVIEYCNQSEAEKVYCVINNNEPYIYFLFYNEFDVNKYRVYLPDEIEENSILILPKGLQANYDKSIKSGITINNYEVYEY